jgi:hypothetical protein
MKYGVGFGLATGAWTLVEYALGFHTTRIAAGQLTSYLALVLPITFIVLAALAERRRLGAISFGRALGVALLVMLVGDVISTPLVWAYHHFILPDWMERLTAFERERLLLQGTAPAEVDRRLAALAMSASMTAQIVGGVVGSTVIGLLIGIPTAFLVRRRGAAPRNLGAPNTVAA